MRRLIYWRSVCALVALVLMIGPLAGCGKLGFDVGQDLQEQRVTGSALGGILPSFLAAPIPLQVDLKAETEKRNTGPASHAYLKSLTLSATPRSAPSGNFDFLESVHIYVAQRGGGTLPKVEIATLQPVPKGQTTVSFVIVPDVDLLPYINVGAEITATASGRQPQKDFTFDGHLEVTIKI